MDKIILDNQLIGKYNVSLELNSHSYGLYSRHKWIKRDFLLTISGVLKSKNTFIECNDNINSVFDNDKYFSKRILIDFMYDYINTLDSEIIKTKIKNNINKDFNVKIFKDITRETNLKNERYLDNKILKFTDLGKKISNFCFTLSLVTDNLFVLNSDYNYSKEVKEILYNYLTKKNKYNMLICESNDVDVLNKYFEKVIIFTDYLDAYVIDPKKDTFILTNDNIKLKDKLFKFDNMVYTLNNYTKDEFKELKKSQKLEVISFKEMIEKIDSLNIGDKYDFN